MKQQKAVRYRLIIFFLLLAHSVTAQTAKKKIRKMEQVRFKHPVMVILRFSMPDSNAQYKAAEYKIVVEKSLLRQMDTLTIQGMLHHPKIYFLGINGGYLRYKVSVIRVRRYGIKQPVTVGRLYTFGAKKFKYAQLKRPPWRKFYAVVESADPYKRWVVQQSSTDAIYDMMKNTLPHIDFVKAIYCLGSSTDIFPSENYRKLVLSNKKIH